ncbi:MAG: response regulator [Opitutae bacterium]|nr:response regulator [Opitutae bacterium]
MSVISLKRRSAGGGGSSHRTRRLPRGLALLLCAGLAAAHAAAQTDPDDPAANLPATTLTTVSQFWNYRHHKPKERQALRLEFVATYYDPDWNILWGTQDDGAFFLPVAPGHPLPLSSGQRVRLTGSVVPEAGIVGGEVECTVLAENAWPAPRSIAGRIAQSDQFDARWVTLEGVVCDQQEADATHIKYRLLAEGRLVTARLLVHSGDPVPQLVGARLRVTGVYIGTKDPSGALQRVDIWMPTAAHFEITGQLATDPRFNLPRTPIAALGQAAADGWLRVAGKVVRHDPGQSLVLRDDTGQLHLRTPQPGTLAEGEEIEIVGRRAGGELEWTLRDPVFRPIARGGAAHAIPAAAVGQNKLRLAAQVLELRPDDVEQHPPVELYGVVTWSHPKAPFFYLQDASGGVCLRLATDTVPPPIGRGVIVTGRTQRGAFAPEVKVEQTVLLTELAPPAPRIVTLEQALTGAEEARWVELRGYLRQVSPDGPWLRLDFTTTTGEFSAFAAPQPDFAALTGAVVRIAGVCAAESNARHELTSVRLWVTDPQSILVETPPATDPFDAPARTIVGLRQFAARDAIERRVRVVGTVTRQSPGRSLFVQDGESGLLVLSRDTAPATPGERVEVVGFPGREGSRVVLRAASWRRTTAGAPPLPALDVPHPAETQPELDARLVRLRGVVTAVTTQLDETKLVLRDGGVFFEAQLPGAAPAATPRVGSDVELTGIYAVQFDESRRPRRFALLLRSPADIAVLAEPSWWTPARFALVAGLFALCSTGGIAWVVVLRRRVARQTEQIRAQMANEARLQAELERSSRLESLGVLAGGIAHDFNNLLTAVIGNLGLVALEDAAMHAAGHHIREAQRAAKRASDVTQQLLTFAKGGDPVREAVMLSEVVQEAATFALHGAKVGSEFSCQADLPAAHVDAGQISRVVHNLVLNAVQAMPEGGIVRLALIAVDVAPGEIATLAPGRYVQLKVADNGPGIPAENAARIFEPYFSTKGRNSGLGLATVHSIVKKHQGHIAVESQPGRGTTFRVWLPAAHERPVAPAAPPPTVLEKRAVRVLLMDDEEIIRNVAGAFLKRFGHDATLVADGAQAVRTYAEAQQSGHPFDVVILDLTVPGGMGGREALTQLRTIDPDVRAVASSGYSSDPVLANYRAHGFRAIMPKPYDLKTFASLLEELRST